MSRMARGSCRHRGRTWCCWHDRGIEGRLAGQHTRPLRHYQWLQLLVCRMGRRIHPVVVGLHRHDRRRVHKAKRTILVRGGVVLGSRIPANFHPLTAGKAVLLALRLRVIHLQLRHHRVVHSVGQRGRPTVCAVLCFVLVLGLGLVGRKGTYRRLSVSRVEQRATEQVD
jgi:hypothetical protein